MNAALLLVLAAAAAPPTYLVERVVSADGGVRRVSVFRDGTAVLAWSNQGAAKTVRTRHLTEPELAVLAQVVRECYAELKKGGAMGEGLGSAFVELRLAPVDLEPMTVRYSLAAVPMLVADRLARAVDEIETLLLTGKPEREDLREWQPQLDEWIELDDGRIVKIIETMKAGESQLYRLQIGNGPLTISMVEEELRRLAARRVQP
jgi:hypothetical protein